jgi:hypothetical protein
MQTAVIRPPETAFWMQTAVSSRMRLEVRFAGVLLTFGTTPVVGELVRATPPATQR